MRVSSFKAVLTFALVENIGLEFPAGVFPRGRTVCHECSGPSRGPVGSGSPRFRKNCAIIPPESGASSQTNVQSSCFPRNIHLRRKQHENSAKSSGVNGHLSILSAKTLRDPRCPSEGFGSGPLRVHDRCASPHGQRCDKLIDAFTFH